MKCKAFVMAIVAMLTVGTANADFQQEIQLDENFSVTVVESETTSGGLSYLFTLNYTGTGEGIKAFGFNATTVDAGGAPVDAMGQVLFGGSIAIVLGDFAGLLPEPGDDSHGLVNSANVLDAGSGESSSSLFFDVAFRAGTQAQVDLANVAVAPLADGGVNGDGSRTSAIIEFGVGAVDDAGASFGATPETRATFLIGVPEPASIAVLGLAGLMLVRRRK